jgi:hypothetical protein
MTTKEEKRAAPELTNLQDDTVKLVAYTIISLRRDHERILKGGQNSIIVRDRMTGRAFISMIIAQYFQEEIVDEKETISRLEWLKKQDPEWDADDLKYLRVYYVVSKRWERQPLKFEENEIDVLREIRDSLP